MKQREPILASFAELAARARQRVGVSARARLEWVVRAVQASQARMTPAELDDFRRDLAVFASGARGGGAINDGQGDIERPNQGAAVAALRVIDTMLTAAVERQSVLIGRGQIHRRLVWDAKTSRYIDTQTSDLTGLNWEVEAREKLGRLLAEFGHLVRRCDAPASRSDAKCGTLFLAARMAQKFCSTRCQARAATKRFREGHKQASKAKAKKGAKNG